jgi:hypothetical protein
MEDHVHCAHDNILENKGLSIVKGHPVLVFSSQNMSFIDHVSEIHVHSIFVLVRYVLIIQLSN